MMMRRLVLLTSLSLVLAACGKEEAAAPEAAATTPPATAAAVTTPPSLPAPPSVPVPPPPRVDGRGFVLMDFGSGQVLAATNENERMEPASLTKLMTAYAVFDALRAGKLKLEDTALVSEHAWRVGGAGTDGSTSFMPIGSQVPVDILLKGMIIQSGNDASIALAERVAGTEEAFAQLMNEYAKRLGMTGTNYENATGLPSPNEYTSPKDMSLLAQALVRDFPQYYHYFSEREFTYNGIKQHNRNGLLARDPTVDGLKTGHTEAAGYCLVTSAQRNGMRVVAVIMGSPSIKAREDGSAALLNYGFGFFESHRFTGAGEPLLTAKVWKGQAKSVQVATATDASLTVPRGQIGNIKSTIEVPAALTAPLSRDREVGRLRLSLDGKELGSWPVFPTADVAEAGFFGRLADSARMWVE
ncbi:MAG: D-alanyl-D-alanine carboxypeptidase family protein [Steroidobacteraceae bacterium]